jgi:peptide/nickel transport system ATP-binding protein
LDVSIQAQLLNLLKDLQADLWSAFLFINHNLSVARRMSDNMVVLRNGRIEEQGPSEQLFGAPKADYTKTLLGLTPTMPKEWRRAG